MYKFAYHLKSKLKFEYIYCIIFLILPPYKNTLVTPLIGSIRLGTWWVLKMIFIQLDTYSNIGNT